MGFTNGILKREEPTRKPKRERRRYAKARLNTCGLIKFIIKEKIEKITPRANEPGEMCRGEMKSSLGVVKLGILGLRLSGVLDARGCQLLRRRSVMPWWRRGSYAATKFSKNKVVETRELFIKLSFMQYKGRGQVREHIYQMNTVTTKLGQLGVEVSDKMLMEFVLKSLPPRFDHFKLTYSIQEHKWSLEDLTSLCAQEELRLNEVNFESANFASTSKSKKRKQEKINQCGTFQKDQKRQKHDKVLTCFHCRKPGHFKKDCKKYHAWRAKKGNFITLVCTEVNLAVVSTDTWWLDSGATIHVSMSMQGCFHCRKPRSEEKYVFTSNDISARVEGVGMFRLLLNTGHFVDLIDTFVVPTFRRNLVSVSTLDKSSYTCTFGNRKVSIKYEDNVIGTGTLLQDINLYMLILSLHQTLFCIQP